MSRCERTTRHALILALLLLVSPPLANGAVQDRLGFTSRDEWQRVPDIFEALAVRPGGRFADVGAGGGYFTDLLSREVGAEGRIYAVDISERALLRLDEWRADVDRTNIELILGEVDDPRLPYRSLDGALITNAYHEFEQYEAMLAGIRRALEPGGRLVIVDNTPADSTASRAEQTEDHDIALDLVAADLQQTGFRVLDRRPDFVVRDMGGRVSRQWMLVAERPSQRVPAPAGLDLDPEANVGAATFWCGLTEPVERLESRASPPDSAEAAVGGGRIKVCYSRPSARGRTVMGELVPYGEPWRTGANEATLVHLGFDAEIAGVRLSPGSYSLYTVPGEREWEVVLNRSVYRQGVPIDAGTRVADVGRGRVPVEPLDEHVEMLTLQLRETGPESAELWLEWERTRVRIPIHRR